MNRYLLDSNIISNAIKPIPSPSLATWMVQQVNDDLFIASITIAEIWRGVLEMPAGTKRRSLETWFLGTNGPRSRFAGRIFPFDEEAGMIWGRLMSEGTKVGRPRSGLDMIIAAIAEANGCVLVTDNEEHFAGLKFFNPMRLVN